MLRRCGVTESDVIAVVNFFRKVKDFCVEYWKALVGLILVLIGFILGRKMDDEEIETTDAKLESERYKKVAKDIEGLSKDHVKESRENMDDMLSELDDAEEKREKTLEKLSNNDKKLDKILQEEFGLNKGE